MDKSYPHSYAPLFETLDRFGYSLKDLKRKAKLADSTILKITWGEPIMVSSICKIAIFLGVEVSDIIEPNYEWDPYAGKTRKGTVSNIAPAPIPSSPVSASHKVIEPNCDLCQLRRNETCGKLTNAICEDYKEVPVTDPDAIGITFPGGIMDATYYREKHAARKAEQEANSD